MTIEGIRRASKDFTADFFKLFDTVAKSDDFSGANESEIFRVETGSFHAGLMTIEGICRASNHFTTDFLKLLTRLLKAMISVEQTKVKSLNLQLIKFVYSMDFSGRCLSLRLWNLIQGPKNALFIV